MKTIRFLLSAIFYGFAYIDVDGCILRKFAVPDQIKKHRFQWWKENLQPTEIVWRRLALLYALRFFRVKLILWTNRSGDHVQVTKRALSRHYSLFHSYYYYGGLKSSSASFRHGPAMDDEERYLGHFFGDLLVESEV